MALLLLGLPGGASIKRDGPTVRVSTPIMFAPERPLPQRQPGLILTGANATMAAAFNLPFRVLRSDLR